VMPFVPPPGHPCVSHGCDGCATCRSARCCASTGSSVAAAGQVLHADLDARTEDVCVDAEVHLAASSLIAHDILVAQLERAAVDNFACVPTTTRRPESVAELPPARIAPPFFSTTSEPPALIRALNKKEETP